MGKIKHLDMLLANKIAAGEVVENPVSVVKELLDNAIDAKATRIAITIEEGGKKHIQCADNGTGIETEDVELAFSRFTTSKIEKEDDLWHLSTLGFRGEFLPSVASVAKVTLSTRTVEESVGTEVVVEGGNLVSRQNVGRGVGTTVSVRDLFYNTPARRKFLKKDSTEFAYINELVRKYALAHQTCTFTLTHNDVEILNIPASNLLDSIIRVLGKDLARNLVFVTNESNTWKFWGYISKPIERQKSRRSQFFYVNQRVIRSELLSSAVEEGYSGRMLKGEFPICILFLQSKKEKSVDVNVHPRKEEVRFADEDAVFLLVSSTIEKTLTDKVPIDKVIPAAKPSLSSHFFNQTRPNNSESMQDTSNVSRKEKTAPTPSVQTEAGNQPLPKEDLTSQDESSSAEITEKLLFDQGIERRNLKTATIIGQVFETYIIAEVEDLVLIIDQHAAAERVNYDILMSTKKGKKLHLLAKKELALSPIQKEYLVNVADEINSMGFDVELKDDKCLISAVPINFGELASIEVLQEILAQVEKQKLPKNTFESEMAALASCHRSIRANEVLTQKEMERILHMLAVSDAPFTCPHGRPVIIQLRKKELEHRFKRS